jgi:nucleoside-triphosphatase
MKKKNILLTGLPGIGKTMLIQKVAIGLQDRLIKGFYTSEIREEGIRIGFELVSFDQRTAILAHVGKKGPYRVGKYGVDLEAFDTFLSKMDLNDPDIHVVIIDEIGKMECYSENFKRMVDHALDSDTVVLATIGKKGNPFMERIKKQEDVRVIEITKENRDILDARILEEIRSLLQRK